MLRLVLLTLCLPLLFVAACEDEEERELPRTGAFEGHVVRIEDQAGYGPVTVALYDIETLSVVAHAVTDQDGLFLIEDLEPGRYTPVVYDEHRVTFHLDRPRYELRRGETVKATIPMVDADFYADTGIFLQGQILDRADDSPIPYAVVDVSDLANGGQVEYWAFSELGGRSGPLTAVTDAEGRYRVGPLPIVFMPSGDQLVPHLRVHHPLYVDSAVGPWDRFQVPSVRNVRLDRGEDTASVRGRLVHLRKDGETLTKPAPGLRVAIEWQAMPGLFPKLLLSIPSTVSDDEGFFEFQGLPPGRFLLLPAYPQDDGFVGEWQRTVQIDRAGDAVEIAQPLAVSPAMRLLSPADGALVEDPSLFDWEDFPEATSYSIIIRRGEDLGGYVANNRVLSQFTVNQDARELLEGGHTFHWGVIAYGAGGELSRSERDFVLKR